MTFHDILRQAIEESGLSLNEISKRSGVACSTLSRFMWAESDLTISKAQAVAQAINWKLELTRKRGRPYGSTKE